MSPSRSSYSQYPFSPSTRPQTTTSSSSSSDTLSSLSSSSSYTYIPTAMNAPLSSPSIQPSSRSQYFPSHNYNTRASASAAAASHQQQQQQQEQHQHQHQHQAQQQQQQQHTAQPQLSSTAITGAARTDGTSPFLRDFNLVAEAAKRAQMAVLMRDMEAVGLS